MVNFGVRNRPHGPLDFEPRVVGQIKLGANFDVEFVGEIPFIGKDQRLDRRSGSVGRWHRVRIFAQLLQALH